jgi:O-antigen/teichoic acid export membrane protein
MIARLRESDFVRHGAMTFASLMFGNVSNYAYYVAVTRRVGVEGYGAFFAMAASIVIFSVPGIIAMAVLANMAADLKAANDAPRVKRLVHRSLQLFAGIIVPALVVVSLESGPIARFYNLTDSRIIIAAAVTIAITLLLSVLRGILQGLQDFGGLALSFIVEGLVKIAIAIALVVLGTDVMIAVAGLGLSCAFSLVYALVRLHENLPQRAERLRIRFDAIARQYAGVAAGIFAVTTLSMYDIVLVKHYFSPTEAGLYGAAALCGRALYLGVGFLAVIVLPKATSRSRAGEATGSLLLNSVAVIAVVALGALVVLYFAPQLVLRVMTGSAFLAASPLLLRYGVASIMLALANVAVNYKCGIRQFDFVVPILTIMASEIATICVYHPSTAVVVDVLLTGHTLAALAAFYRLALRPTATTSS